MQLDSVFLFRTAGAMDLNYLDQPIEYGWAGVSPSFLKVFGNMATVRWMATGQPLLKLANSFGIGQPFLRFCRVLPMHDESAFGSSQTASQNIIEGIKVPPPFSARDQNSANDVIEFL